MPYCLQGTRGFPQIESATSSRIQSANDVEIVYQKAFCRLSLMVKSVSFECPRLLKRLDFPELKFTLYFMGYEVRCQSS